VGHSFAHLPDDLGFGFGFGFGACCAPSGMTHLQRLATGRTVMPNGTHTVLAKVLVASCL
jgi:hypothetical protein